MTNARNTEHRVADVFGLFVADTGYAEIDAETSAIARGRILDNAGAAVAGSYGWEQTEIFLRGLADAFGTGDLPVIGRGETFAPATAAMANATFSHAIELDDGHRNAGAHLGAVVVPTVLAVASREGRTGGDAIAAVVLGYEIGYRVARNMNPTGLLKGFHPSAVCGVFGAAASAAKLLGCDAAQTAAALGLAGMQAAGLMEATASGQASKCIMVGHAAMAGIGAAFCARQGVVGPTSVFEGKNGILRAMAEDVDPGALTQGLGERFEIADTYVKLYPNCRHIHAAIEAVDALRETHDFAVADIARVTVGTHRVAFDLTGGVRQPKTPADARFSMSYCLAAALLRGGVGMADFEPDALACEDVRALEARIAVRVDDGVQAAFPARRGARVEIALQDGRVLAETVYKLKGSPDLPATWDDIVKKFESCAAPVFSEVRRNEIVTGVMRLGDADAPVSAASLVRLLTLA